MTKEKEQEYERYFDEAEKKNKFPLPYERWLERRRQREFEELIRRSRHARGR